MIDFPCHHCGFKFSVPQEMAGGTIQCPTCHVLVDIPTLSDLESILPDGTYVMDAPEPIPADRLAKTFEAFTRSTTDPLGNEIDLRVTMEDVRRAGVNEPPAPDHPLQEAPKYDPETGELVRPLAVARREQDAASIPFAKAAVNYALPGMGHEVSPWRVYLELFTPMNAIVMAFIFFFHVMLQLLVLIASLLFPVGAAFVLFVAIVAHYGCVIEEIGREEKDELPRPLRDLHFVDDFWWPFWNLIGTLVICYGPAIFALSRLDPEGRMRLFVGGALAMLGTIMVPAVLITLVTSGSVVNLRPDRLLGVIHAAGRYYLLLVAGWIAAIISYATGVIGINYVSTVALLQWSGVVKKRYWILSMLIMMIGVYLMHAFCWHVGLLYRGKQAEFPWVFQRHERQSKREKVAIAQAVRRNLKK